MVWDTMRAVFLKKKVLRKVGCYNVRSVLTMAEKYRRRTGREEEREKERVRKNTIE